MKLIVIKRKTSCAVLWANKIVRRYIERLNRLKKKI